MSNTSRRLPGPVLLILGAVLSLVSCGVQSPHISVLAGNYAFGRGDYQEASIQYLKALEQEEYQAWVQYNLANVYHSLGEFDAAFSLWETALETQDSRLLFAVHFNTGILYYEQGNYEQAFQSFREALVHDPLNLGAKRNLELSLQKLQAGRSGSAPRRSGLSEQEDRSLSADSIRMFEYIRRKEEQVWIQQAQQLEQPYVQDW